MIGIKLGMNLGSNVPTLLQQALSAIRRLGGTALYVPDDYRGAFIDSTGTQPVTAINDLVGLLTDRSYGAGNLGGEIGAASNWNGATGDTTINVGAGTFTTTASTGFGSGANVTAFSGSIVAGKTYRITYTVTFSVVGSGVRVKVGGVDGPVVSASGTYTALLAATGTNAAVIFALGAGSTFTVSAVSVREVLGNHATQPTTASKPVVTQLANGTKALDFDGSNDSLTILVNTGTSGTFIVACVPGSIVWRVLAASGANTTANAGAKLGIDGSGQAYVATTNGVSAAFSYGPVVAVGTPVVLSCVWTPTTQTLYVNGALAQTGSSSVAASTGGNIRVGANQDGTTDLYDGSIVDFAYIPGTLTEADRKTIERNMAQRAGVTYAG